jgi:hypothetical protein
MLGGKEKGKTLKRTQEKRTSNTTQFTEKSKMQFPCGCCHSRHPMTHQNRYNRNKGVCPTVAFPFTLKVILRQKKNYRNSNISPCKNYNLQKHPLIETKILQDIRIL